MCQGRGDTVKYTSHRQLVSCKRTPLFYLFTPVSVFLPFFFAFFFCSLFLFRSPFLSNSVIILITPLSFLSFSVYFFLSFELRYFTYAPFFLSFVDLFVSFFRTALFYLRRFRSSPLPFILPSFLSSFVPFFLSIFLNPRFIGRWRCQRPQNSCSAEAKLLGPCVA